MVYRRRSRRKLCSERLTQYRACAVGGGLETLSKMMSLLICKIILLKDKKNQHLRASCIFSNRGRQFIWDGFT